jgi:hypothetical protein
LHIPNLANKPFLLLLPQELLIFQLKATASQASKRAKLPSFLQYCLLACLPVAAAAAAASQ